MAVRSRGRLKRRQGGFYRCHKTRSVMLRIAKSVCGHVRRDEGRGRLGRPAFEAEPGQRLRKERAFFPPFGSGRTATVLSDVLKWARETRTVWPYEFRARNLSGKIRWENSCSMCRLPSSSCFPAHFLSSSRFHSSLFLLTMELLLSSDVWMLVKKAFVLHRHLWQIAAMY